MSCLIVKRFEIPRGYYKNIRNDIHLKLDPFVYSVRLNDQFVDHEMECLTFGSASKYVISGL